MKINWWIFWSLPDLPWVVWRPLSLNFQGFCSIAEAHGYPSRRLEVYQKFFLRSNEKVDGDEAVQNKRMKADLDGEVENEMKKITYCLLYYRRFPLLCIKRDAPCQLQINWHFDFLNFPTPSSLLHVREVLVRWLFLVISGPQKFGCRQTKLGDIGHEQTIICRQWFVGHMVGSRPMKRKKHLQWMIRIIFHPQEKIIT